MITVKTEGTGVYRSEVFFKEKIGLTPRRTVYLYEFEYFIEDYEYGLLNNQQVGYKKNTVLIAKPGDVRQSKNHFSCYYAHVDIQDEIICQMVNDLPPTVAIDDEQKYTQIFQNICSSFPHDNDAKKVSCIGWLMILIASLANDSKGIHQAVQETPENQKNAILSAKAYMNYNYKSDIKLEDIASSIHMSPNYFHKLFTSACGITPLQYLTKIRMEKAKSKLMCSEKTITEIAENCGFNSYSYFCTVFKNQCGMTPTEFRKNGNKYYKI